MRKILLLAGIATAFLMGYGAITWAYPAYPPGILNRAEFHGYFTNHNDSAGTYVFPNGYFNASVGYNEAFPTSINTAQEFIDFVEGKGSFVGHGLTGDNQEKTGAAFLIESMQMINGTSSVPIPTALQKTNWEKLVKTAEAQGHITWRTNYSYTLNSYYQGPKGGSNGLDNDDAFYDESATSPAMVFRDGNNVVKYVIKWLCANPIGPGLLGPLQTAWEAQGRSKVTDGHPDPGDDDYNITTRPGDVVHFDHYIKNNGPGGTSPDNIWFDVLDDIGASKQGGVGINSGSYTLNEERLAPDTDPDITVPLMNPAPKYCRQILWDWKNSWGAGDPGHNHAGVGLLACAYVQNAYNLTPSIKVLVNGLSGNYAEPGDTITFEYAVNNSANGSSPSIPCNIYGFSRNGFYNIPNPIDGASANDPGYSPPPGVPGCPRTFSGATPLGSENVAALPNKSVCRSLFVDPATPGGGPLGTEGCAYVTSKPYARVYGGDVSAGKGIVTSSGVCPVSNGAAVVGWNKRSPSWAGAGVQFATFAISKIFDSATALGNNGGAATPIGLGFANAVTDSTAGNFGGDFSNVPCTADHYDESVPLTGMPSPFPVNPGDYTYSASGNVNLPAITVNSGVRATIYVTGNVFITNDVTYNGSWTSGNIPMFRLIVEGNIFVSNAVTRLDGLYVAQPTGSTDGVFYTCATGTSALPPDGSLVSTCNSKLTVNGGVVARQIQLLRTSGSLRNSTANESAAGGNMAEAFNYSPLMWIPQPATATGATEYDSVTTLPPVL